MMLHVGMEEQLRLMRRIQALEDRVLSEKLIAENDTRTRFYTGFPTYGSFKAFVVYLEPKAERLTTWTGKNELRKPRGPKPWQNLSIADQLLAVLVRLRLGVSAYDICVRMSVTEGSFSRMFGTWIAFLARELKLLFPFPSRKQIDDWVPRVFRSRYANTRIIIDCYEIQCQRPSGLMNQSMTYSDYKSRNTFKVLVGCTPSGLVSFVSEVVGGRMSDREVTMTCGLIDLLQEGDMIMADRGFEIQESVAPKGNLSTWIMFLLLLCLC